MSNLSAEDIPIGSATTFRSISPTHSQSFRNSSSSTLAESQNDSKPKIPRVKERRAFAPEQHERDTAKVILNSGIHQPPTIEPLKREFSEPFVKDWQRCVHPVGAVYYHHPSLGVVTDADLTDDQNLCDIMFSANWLLADVEKLGVSSGERRSIDLVLGLSCPDPSQPPECKYYFADHQKQVIFWLDPYNSAFILFNVDGVQQEGHLRYALETQYWRHCEFYPNHRSFEESPCQLLKDMLTYSIAEALLSSSPLTPFSVGDLKQMYELVTSIEATEGSSAHTRCVLARLMRIFTHLKFHNFHGQRGARMNADQSVYTSEAKADSKSFFFVIWNALLFNAPSEHAKQLRTIWVDRSLNILLWRKFIDGLCSEWLGFTTYSTVMLAVDVSFMAVPMPFESTFYQRSAFFAISLSTISAVGSIVMSVLLLGQYRGHAHRPVDDAAKFMGRMAKTRSGLEALAMMYSLPHALIMWAMLCFVVALAFLVFPSVTAPVRVVIAAVWAVVAILALSPVWWRGEVDKNPFVLLKKVVVHERIGR